MNRSAGRMLCDHAKDPDENANVAEDPACASVVAELDKRLTAKMASTQ